MNKEDEQEANHETLIKMWVSGTDIGISQQTKKFPSLRDGDSDSRRRPWDYSKLDMSLNPALTIWNHATVKGYR